jgi:hypothetical protein
MKKLFRSIMFTVIILALTFSVAAAGGNARRPAIINAADRVVELQRTDAGWEGTWYWYVGNTADVTNLTGVTALGLIEAYKDTKDIAYLDAAIGAADFIQAHLGAGATGTQYHVRTTAPDIVFLYKLSNVTGDTTYATRANQEWNNITIFWPTAGDLDSLFRAISRSSAWDIAFFLEAAYLSGDTVWADDAAAILANKDDPFYYGATDWYALNLAGSIRALVGSGYAGVYNDEIVWMLNELINLSDGDSGVGGYVQDTAYAVMAFSTVGGAANKYANDLGRWLASQQLDNGGWLEDSDEYAEFNGEALRALSSTIGTDVTLDGFDSGVSGSLISSWQKSTSGNHAIPSNGE